MALCSVRKNSLNQWYLIPQSVNPFIYEVIYISGLSFKNAFTSRSDTLESMAAIPDLFIDWLSCGFHCYFCDTLHAIEFINRCAQSLGE